MTEAAYNIIEILDDNTSSTIEKMGQIYEAGYNKIQLDEAVCFYAVKKQQVEEKLYILMACCGMKLVLDQVTPISKNGSDPEVRPG